LNSQVKFLVKSGSKEDLKLSPKKKLWLNFRPSLSLFWDIFGHETTIDLPKIFDGQPLTPFCVFLGE
jgi:hypothetical protein